MNVVLNQNDSQIIRNTKLNGEFGAAETSSGIFTKEKNPLLPGEVPNVMSLKRVSYQLDACE